MAGQSGMFSSHVIVRSESSIASGIFFWVVALSPVLALIGITFWQTITLSKGMSETATFIEVLPNGFLLLVLLLAAVLLFFRIFRPASALSQAAQAIAGQDILPVGKALPELLAIQDRLQRVQIDLLASNRDTTEARKALSRAEEKSESERKNAQEEIDSLEKFTDTLGVALSKLRAGCLDYRIEEVVQGRYERLRLDFNTTVEEFQKIFMSLNDSVSTISSGSAEIASAADDLARRTEQQVSRLEETTLSVGAVTEAVKKTAESATHASAVARQTVEQAESSGEVMAAATAAMLDIQGSSKQIGQILGLLDDITFQTNLLALNAGVEAARAGVAGRGFAVVATEVRALAQRSADAAKDIKSLITSSTQQISKGTVLVQETGEAMKKIVGNVGEISFLISEIATTAQKQANNLSEISASVSQMDQNTQQNAAMVEEATAASHNLSAEAAELLHIVHHFHLCENDNYSIHGETDFHNSLLPQNLSAETYQTSDEGWEEFR
ncbi:methyl-accepting chemotaxis protein [Gluconobacter japonicus]|uniref:methyl-accepting chemotaxis protein n=1 Tax=Gluconobacter japonicus TaxID=376620 RepID=UPI0024AD1E52|nr:methyl-accepting chemotaxis protein [Gluconobacter japonicus]MDI6651414.1 methyl-accepting chemotaxis protein [Gluconobacter japonicus]